MPDIILLDLHLPDMHGDQVLSELKAARAQDQPPQPAIRIMPA